MKKNWGNLPWYSSYEENNYGDFFFALMRIYKPEKVVELGTKAGYSAYHIARALRANGKGSIDCYDLWDQYQFDCVPKTVAQKNLAAFRDIIQLELADAIGVHEKYKTVDILHVDLSNDGKLLEQVVPFWIDKVTQLIIIEGGSMERDQVPWMGKYDKMPIAKWLEDFSRRQKDMQYITFEPFPSVTVIKKLALDS